MRHSLPMAALALVAGLIQPTHATDLPLARTGGTSFRLAPLPDAPTRAAARGKDGITRFLPPPETDQLPEPGTHSLAGFDPLFGGEMPDLLRRTLTDWFPVANPNLGTNRQHVKLESAYTNGLGQMDGGVCSGVLISPIHVLTAGHCVFIREDREDRPVQAFADSLWATPAYDNGTRPYERGRSVGLLTWAAWIDDGARDSDIGLITLDRPMGAIVGWRSYGTNANSSFWESSFWRQLGYPSQAPNTGEILVERNGSFDDYRGGTVEADGVQPSGGASGSGSMKNDTIWGLHTASRTVDGLTEGITTRVSSQHYFDIQQQISSDLGNAVDLWPLQVQTSIGDNPIQAGAGINWVRVLMANVSNANFDGSVPFRILLSDDAILDASDVTIHDGIMNLNLPQRSQTIHQVNGVVVPGNVSTGDKRLIVVLDQSDARNANNVTPGVEQATIQVACDSLPRPVNLSPGDGITCLDPSAVLLQWADQSSAAEYRVQLIQLGPDTTTWTTEGYTTGTSYLLTGLDPGALYGWRIQSRRECGFFGEPSFARSFRVQDEAPATPALLFPPDGDTCQPDFQVVVDWSDVPDAVAYQVRLASSCGFPVPPVTTTLSVRAFLGLNAGQTYYWQARSQGDCGNWSEWSACRSFTPKPQALGTPTTFFPANGFACVGTPAGVSWEQVPVASSYEVQFGSNCAQGDTITVDSNVAQIPIPTEGTWFWRVRAITCDVVGEWSACRTFETDLTPPSNVQNLVSVDTPPGEWTNAPEVSIAWNEVADPGSCNIVQYVVTWNTDPNPGPLPWIDGTNDTFYLTPPLPDGRDNYIHVRAKDGAGNYSPNHATVGPFLIDTTGPTIASVQSTVPSNGWFDGSQIGFDWSAGDDGDGSGVSHYAVLWTRDPIEPLSSGVQLTDTAVGFNGMTDGDWFLKLAAVDQLGNQGAVQMHGPFRVDAVAPDARFVELDFEQTFIPGDGMIVEWEVSDGQSSVETLALLYSFDGETWEVDFESPYEQIGDVVEFEFPVTPNGQLWLRLDVTDAAGNTTTIVSERAWSVEVSVDAPSLAASGPERTTLAANIPNPFNPRTTIHYGLAQAGPVRVRVHDLAGRVVRTLVNESAVAGWHQVVWDGQDDSGRSVASGRYFVRVDTASDSDARAVTLIK